MKKIIIVAPISDSLINFRGDLIQGIKNKGCKVVGLAGSVEICNWLKDDLGVDHVIYLKNENILESLKNSCPDGIDIYFDNVGGETLDAALTLMNKFGRIPVCGLISMYNDWSSTGPKMYRNILMKTLTVTGFLVSDYLKICGWRNWANPFYQVNSSGGINSIGDKVN